MHSAIRVLLIAAIAATAVHAQGAPAPSLDVTLKPMRDSTGNVATLGVSLRFAESAPPNGFAVQMPVTIYTHRNIADRVQDLRMSDQHGDVAVTTADESGTRYWRPARAVSLPVTVTYRSTVPPRRIVPGPPIDLRTADGGVSGGGSGFLVLPRDSRQYRIRLRWDLSDVAAGSIGVASLGEGEFETVAPLNSLLRSFYLAGPLGRYPATGSANGLAGFWLGTKDGVDMRAEMEWAGRAYGALRTYFRDTTPPKTYRVLTRVLPEPETSGGTASISSFMLQVPKGSRSGDTTQVGLSRGVMTHEMIHGWVGGISGSSNTQWFGEGGATYFTARAYLVLGLQSLTTFAREVSRLSRDYYANPFRNVSADSAANAFWIHSTGERLPYARGALYFFSLDHRIKKASEGRRSLDDVFFELFDRRAHGQAGTTESFVAAIVKELGPGVAAEFDSVIVRGTKTIELPPDALGKCFERRTVEATVPDFLIDRRDPRQLVVNLAPESAPYIAGLRNGDQIVTDLRRASASDTVVYDLKRGTESLTVRYVARPALVNTYEWAPAAGISETECRR